MRNNEQDRDAGQRYRNGNLDGRGADRSSNGRSQTSRDSQGRSDGSESGNWGSSDSDGQYDDENWSGPSRAMRAGRDGMEGSSYSDRESMDGGSQRGGNRQSWGNGGRNRDADSNRNTAQSGSRTEGSHTGKGPKGYQRSDERIKEDVSERLLHHGDVDASDVEVGVNGGEVTLSGTVPHKQMKRQAEECLDSCLGVGHVQNNLRVGSQRSEGESSNGSSNKSTSSSGRTGGSSTNANSTNGNTKGDPTR